MPALRDGHCPLCSGQICHPKAGLLKPTAPVIILVLLCLALGAGWLFQRHAAVKERKGLEEKAAFLSNQWRQTSADLARQKEEDTRLKADLGAKAAVRAAAAAKAAVRANLITQYINARETYFLAVNVPEVTTTSPRRSYVDKGIYTSAGEAAAARAGALTPHSMTFSFTHPAPEAFNKSRVTNAQALVAACGSAADVAAASHDRDYAIRAADLIAARSDPVAWNSSNERIAAANPNVRPQLYR